MAIWRFELSPRPGQADPVGRQTARLLEDFGVHSIRTVRSARLFTIELDAADLEADERPLVQRIAEELLTDPVTESCHTHRREQTWSEPDDAFVVEIHFKPGVMDNVANSTLLALRDMGIAATNVRTARRYEFRPVPDDADRKRIPRLLGNDCIEDVIIGAKPIEPAPAPPLNEFELRHVPVRRLDETGLERLSRDSHLFLSLEEMQAIQAHYRGLDRDPTDLEIETLAQTWSEHCVHKTLKAAIEYRGAPFPTTGDRPKSPRLGRGVHPPAKSPLPRSGGGPTDVSNNCGIANCGTGVSPVSQHRPEACATGGFVKRYANLLKDTIARATDDLMGAGRGPQCLSVFKDNAGIIAFDDDFGIAFKVETHNHPSAIEPYGGAATGVGGCIRDVLGCGLGAKPIANTDVFCVAPPDWPIDVVPKGVIHPKTVLKGVVAGVRDYGNRMGIPTVNGAIHFDPRYLGNPLVYCGCIGLIPRNRIDKAARPGDAVVLLGGRTGRDGIHGATFSSAELTDTHVDEFAHAVQIGNPIEEKKILDIILQARDYPCKEGPKRDESDKSPRPRPGGTPVDQRPPSAALHPSSFILHPARCLYSAITDCGAGGLSSAVGEMAAEIGAEVDLETVPLKYAGLRHDEIWISEAQERMVLAVPPENVDALLALAGGEDVEATVIGRFTDTGRLVVRYQGTKVGDLDMHFLHHGLPKTTRQAEWWPTETPQSPPPNPQSPIRNPQSPIPNPQSPIPDPQSLVAELKRRLADPTTASKHWVIRQYDHEVQGRSVVKPLVGRFDGPSDAAVLRPRLDSNRGIAIGCGLAPQLSDVDPYWMAVAAIDEALRNVVCVGGDPKKTAILDNFCWPRVDDPRSLGALVRACQACYDVATAYGLPFISGKDSLNNEFALDPADVEMVREVIRKQTQRAVPPALYAAQRRQGSPARSSPNRNDPTPTVSDPLRNGRLPIPYTLLISAVSLIEDVNRCVTMDLKHDESELFLVGQPTAFAGCCRGGLPPFDLSLAARTHHTVAQLIRDGLLSAVHDVSDGGVLVACAEMASASNRSLFIRTRARPPEETPDDSHRMHWDDGNVFDFYFEPSPALYIVEVPPARARSFVDTVLSASVPRLPLTGKPPQTVSLSPVKRIQIDMPLGGMNCIVSLEDLRAAWRHPLAW